MATAQRKTASLRASRIASLKAKIRSKSVQKKATASSKPTKQFASLKHILNATALYQMGHYQRASLAFQKAMAEEDAPEMLEHLETVTDSVHCEVEDEDYLSGDVTDDGETEESELEDLEDIDVNEDDLDTDDLDTEESVIVDPSSDGLVVDEASSQDVLDGTQDDFSVDEDEVDEPEDEVFSVQSRAQSNLKALAKKK